MTRNVIPDLIRDPVKFMNILVFSDSHPTEKFEGKII